MDLKTQYIVFEQSDVTGILILANIQVDLALAEEITEAETYEEMYETIRIRAALPLTLQIHFEHILGSPLLAPIDDTYCRTVQTEESSPFEILFIHKMIEIAQEQELFIGTQEICVSSPTSETTTTD